MGGWLEDTRPRGGERVGVRVVVHQAVGYWGVARWLVGRRWPIPRIRGVRVDREKEGMSERVDRKKGNERECVRERREQRKGERYGGA